MDAGKTGAYLAALRKARGMTQQEAADQLGVSNKTVSKWENGAGLPDITVLPALAELYGVTADDILAGETLRGRPAEAQGPARRRLLLLRLVRLGRLEVDFAEMRYYDTMQAWKPLLFAVGLALLCAVLERALRRRAGADASLLWIPERLRPMLHRSGGFLRRTRRLWLVWLAWAVLLAGLWFLADGQLDRVLAPWIARYGEELVQSGFPESWTILRGRLEADVALWLRLRQGVLIAGAVSGAGVLVWTLLHWKKRRPPLAEEGET